MCENSWTVFPLPLPRGDLRGRFDLPGVAAPGVERYIASRQESTTGMLRVPQLRNCSRALRPFGLHGAEMEPGDQLFADRCFGFQSRQCGKKGSGGDEAKSVVQTFVTSSANLLILEMLRSLAVIQKLETRNIANAGTDLSLEQQSCRLWIVGDSTPKKPNFNFGDDRPKRHIYPGCQQLLAAWINVPLRTIVTQVRFLVGGSPTSRADNSAAPMPEDSWRNSFSRK